MRDAGQKVRSRVRQLSLARDANVTSRMLHLGKFVALLIAVSTLGQLTTGQPTVDSELINERCDCSDSSEYVALLRGLLAGQRRLESKLQHLRQSNDDGFETRESRHNGKASMFAPKRGFSGSGINLTVSLIFKIRIGSIFSGA